jgi:CrcB protein
MAGWVQRWGSSGGGFPIGTMLVNVLGCLVIGFLATLLTGPMIVREEYRLGLIVGVLGGFTTFSSFSWDSHQLAASGQLGLAAIYVIGTNAGCLLAAWIGHRLSMGIFGS